MEEFYNIYETRYLGDYDTIIENIEKLKKQKENGEIDESEFYYAILGVPNNSPSDTLKESYDILVSRFKPENIRELLMGIYIPIEIINSDITKTETIRECIQEAVSYFQREKNIDLNSSQSCSSSLYSSQCLVPINSDITNNSESSYTFNSSTSQQPSRVVSRVAPENQTPEQRKNFEEKQSLWGKIKKALSGIAKIIGTASFITLILLSSGGNIRCADRAASESSFVNPPNSVSTSVSPSVSPSVSTVFSEYIPTGDLADPEISEAVETYDKIVTTGEGELSPEQLRNINLILGDYYTDLRNNSNAEPTNVISVLTNDQFTGVVDNTSYKSIKKSYEEIVTKYVQYNVDNGNVVALDVESQDVANMTIISLGTDSKTYYALPKSVQDVLELNTLEVLNSITIDKINENMHVENIGDLAVVETGIEVDYNGHKVKLVLTVEQVDYLYQNVYNDLGLNKGISPCK